MVNFKSLLTTNYPEDPQLFKWGLFALIALLVAVFGIFVQFPNEHAANVFAFMLAITVIILGFEFSGNKIVKAQFLGKKSNFFIAIILGSIAGFIFASSPQFIIGTPTRLAVTPFALANTLNFFYVVVVASIVETTFFRGVLFPFVSNLLDNTLLSAILVNLAFGAYHFIAYGGNPALMLGAFAFGLIGTIGNSVLKSLGFELSAHLVNNFLALQGQGI